MKISLLCSILAFLVCGCHQEKGTATSAKIPNKAAALPDGNDGGQNSQENSEKSNVYSSTAAPDGIIVQNEVIFYIDKVSGKPPHDAITFKITVTNKTDEPIPDSKK